MAVVKYWNGSSWVEFGVGTQGVQGTTGIQGVEGPQGLQGVQGAGFDPSKVAYVHQQGVASANWYIQHNLGFYPNITVKDSGGSIVEGEISYTNSNEITLVFSSSFSGTAYLS